MNFHSAYLNSLFYFMRPHICFILHIFCLYVLQYGVCVVERGCIVSNASVIVDKSVCTYAVYKMCAVDKGGAVESGKLKLSGPLALVPKETYPR